MKTLTKKEMPLEELISGLHKSLSAQYLLEKQEIEEVKDRLSLTLHLAYTFLQQQRETALIPIAYEILHDRRHEWGENWSTRYTPKQDVSIVRQLLPLEEYIYLVADALNALMLWNDKEYAQKQLAAALGTLSYEVVSLSF